VELEGVLDRGELTAAIALARDVTEERGRPIDLDIALRFLPLVAVKQAEDYDEWSMRWLQRWIIETPGATVEQAAELSGALADLQTQPTAFDAVQSALARPAD
jgi:hypothetical protein